MEYDGFSAVCTGSKDSDSPGYVCVCLLYTSQSIGVGVFYRTGIKQLTICLLYTSFYRFLAGQGQCRLFVPLYMLELEY